MAMNGWDVLGQGLLGGVMGAAKAGVENAEIQRKEIERAAEAERQAKQAEQQEKVLRDRAAFLEKLKADSANEKEEALRNLRARFYSETAAAAPGKETSVPYTDALGSEDGASSAAASISVKSAPTRRELAEFRLEQAKLSGNATLAKEMYDESRDLRNDDELRRKVAADDRRSAVAERMAAAREQTAATGQARLEAMVAGLIGQGRAPREKSDLPDRKFDAKQWTDFKKEVGVDLVIDDPISGKSRPDHIARHWAINSMRRLQSAGDIDPADAAVLVGGISARVTAAARDAAKGDESKYKKFVVAGYRHEMDKIFSKADTGADEPVPTKPATTAPKAATPQRREGPRLPGRQIFGPLTPESLIQSEAAAGNRDAIEYLKRREEKRAAAYEDQLRREQSGMHGEFQ